MSKDDVYKLWEDLCKELKEKNRFFTQDKILNILKDIKFERFFPDDTKYTLYRARVGNYLEQSDSEMLAPPKHVTLDGRCNPKGIPYLYLALEKDTAIYEVRPNPHEEVTIAELTVDLTNVLSLKPYSYKEITCFWESLTQEQIALIKCIDDGMSRKINDKSKIEYLPFQYIAEYIKSIGFNGFLYSSSVFENGHNLVMFDWEDKVKVVEKTKVKIEKVKYEY